MNPSESTETVVVDLPLEVDVAQAASGPVDDSVMISPPIARPDHVPAKFWDEEHGAVRTEALARSYVELERRMSRGPLNPEQLAEPETRDRVLEALGRPATAEDYAIEAPDELLAPDAEVNRRLHEAGLTQAQAQLVYDLAAERLLPMLSAAAAEVTAQEQQERLVRHFGGESEWREAARQIKAWAQSNLDQKAIEALSGSAQGVLAIHGMMQANEPRLVQDGDSRRGELDESGLHGMMRDPRYWRDRDQQFIARVTEGFKKLYGG